MHRLLLFWKGVLITLHTKWWWYVSKLNVSMLMKMFDNQLMSCQSMVFNKYNNKNCHNILYRLKINMMHNNIWVGKSNKYWNYWS
jgi:hypothetical protein